MVMRSKPQLPKPRQPQPSREGAASANEKMCLDLFRNRVVGVVILDVKGAFFSSNRAFARMLGYRPTELRPEPHWMALLPAKWRDRTLKEWKRISRQQVFGNHEARLLDRSGRAVMLLTNGGVLETRPDGNYLLFCVVLDITARTREAERLATSNGKLSVDLTRTREKLRTTTADLNVAKKEARSLRQNLKKVNDAMRVLIADFQEQKRSLEERIVSNFQIAIEPIVGQLKAMNMPPSQQYLLETLDFGIKHITSYYGINVAKMGGGLTPRELEICQMILHGRNSREIAETLGVAYQTVIVHRKNIRKKFGIKKTKHNLATFVMENL